MSERTIAAGSDLMCFERSGDVGSYTYKPIAGQSSCTLQREENNRESNAKNLGGYFDRFKGLEGWNATVEVDVTDPSDTDANELNLRDLEDYQTAGTKPTWVFAFVTTFSTTDSTPAVDTTKPMWVGKGLVEAPMNAGAGENITSSVTINGVLELSRVDPT